MSVGAVSTCSFSLKVSSAGHEAVVVHRRRCPTAVRRPPRGGAGRDRSRPSRTAGRDRAGRPAAGLSLSMFASSQARLTAKVVAPTPPASPCTPKTTPSLAAGGRQLVAVVCGPARRRVPARACAAARSRRAARLREAGRGRIPRRPSSSSWCSAIGLTSSAITIALMPRCGGLADHLGDLGEVGLVLGRPSRRRRIPARRRRAGQRRPRRPRTTDRPSFHRARLPCPRSEDRSSEHPA